MYDPLLHDFVAHLRARFQHYWDLVGRHYSHSSATNGSDDMSGRGGKKITPLFDSRYKNYRKNLWRMLTSSVLGLRLPPSSQFSKLYVPNRNIYVHVVFHFLRY